MRIKFFLLRNFNLMCFIFRNALMFNSFICEEVAYGKWSLARGSKLVTWLWIFWYFGKLVAVEWRSRPSGGCKRRFHCYSSFVNVAILLVYNLQQFLNIFFFKKHFVKELIYAHLLFPLLLSHFRCNCIKSWYS